ncbi:MAG: hypothetical protein KDJ20_07830 [Hyphomicrobiales bacterium]|nr:hypothetical protein [Hyphomicrobiales bacterium]MCC2108178.1 hypothetical protein [Hyphomicrobiales bacterium]
MALFEPTVPSVCVQDLALNADEKDLGFESHPLRQLARRARFEPKISGARIHGDALNANEKPGPGTRPFRQAANNI